MNPNDDVEEVERRSQLAEFVSPPVPVQQKLILGDRSLEYVGKRAVALSDKGKVARVLDKTKDSAEVVTLVEKLRQAIVVYQVCAGNHRIRNLLTFGTDVPTAIDVQPSIPIDCEFPPSSLRMSY